MIIEFEDKLKRSVIVDTEFIAAIVENVTHQSLSKDGYWSVILSSGQWFYEVESAIKDKIYEVWEEHNG